MEPYKEWQGEFGNQYLARNSVNWIDRVPFWEHIVYNSNARSFFEYGCNAGWNLSAIQYACHQARVSGVDINSQAVTRARCAGLDVQLVCPAAQVSMMDGPIAELTFTAGVLIHIPPEQLPSVMKLLVYRSYDYVLAVEYASLTGAEEPVTYRGKEGMLWRRDYGKLYQDMGLTLVETGEAEGFDRCHYFLMRKP